ncbi:MAG: hypothetical protein M1829_000100 [Trizodia sp. TS-e1964]|nr:MAG: hypothetical protein M1829_000100 [Trizodia sp. TS-e1964]
MCGIFLTLGSEKPALGPNSNLRQLLHKRGPDSIGEYATGVGFSHFNNSNKTLHLSFLSTVLSLRGAGITPQPLVHQSSGSVLCWNGEAWSIKGAPVSGNDAEQILELLVNASIQSKEIQSTADKQRFLLDRFSSAISSIAGPYAFVFWDQPNRRLFFGRDVLGRRSLLQRFDDHGNLTLSSISDEQSDNHWNEVDTEGIHFINLIDDNDFENPAPQTLNSQSMSTFLIKVIPWKLELSGQCEEPSLQLPIPALNRQLPETPPWLELTSPSVYELKRQLSASLRLRVQNLDNPRIPQTKDGYAERPAVAILFSGGLDCTMIARLVHEILPTCKSVDLLNVAFENPRVVKAAKRMDQAGHSLADVISPKIDTEQSPFESCPDRITGYKSLDELNRICLERKWRFVEINIPYAETLIHRQQIISLMRPHNTEMDLSIACAFYFAARGVGVVKDLSSDEGLAYISPARVLLSGLGADELFAGYTRHATAFNGRGFMGLLDELDLDTKRLGRRNLGRDDRIIAHWGKEVRFPYLDEDFLSWALKCEIWEKCGFGQERPHGMPKEPLLEPGKLVLRLAAWSMGMECVASEKKRANAASIRRLASDQASLHTDGLPPNYLFPQAVGFSVTTQDDLTQLTLLITGSHGTPYSQGLWRLHIKMPEDYPHSPPKAAFRTRIWHPNVEEKSGSICVETLKRDWDPKLTLRDVLITISCLLIQPNPDSALNASAGQLLQEDFDAYARQARLMTSIHASIPHNIQKLVADAQRLGDAGSGVFYEEKRPIKALARKHMSTSSVVMKKKLQLTEIEKPTLQPETPTTTRASEAGLSPEGPLREPTAEKKKKGAEDGDEDEDEVERSDENQENNNENKPLLSPSPVIMAQLAIRRGCKRPLSELPSPVDPDMENEPTEDMTASDKNIANNTHIAHNAQTPNNTIYVDEGSPRSGESQQGSRKSPKLSTAGPGINTSGRIRDIDALTSNFVSYASEAADEGSPLASMKSSTSVSLVEGKENATAAGDAKIRPSLIMKKGAPTLTSLSKGPAMRTMSSASTASSANSTKSNKPRTGLRRL